MFAWYQRWKRERLLSQPIDPAWMAWIETRCRPFPHLAAELQSRLVHDIRIFIAERHWEGCNGLAVTDEMRVTIAGASMPDRIRFPGDAV